MSAAANVRVETEYYAQRWNSFEHANSLAMARIAKILGLLQAVDMPERPAICDLGCGAGWATGILGAFGDTIGVDLAPPESARHRYPYCQFIAADVLEWRYPPESFDVVVSQETIEHVQRSDQSRYLNVAHGLLRTGGHLILTTPNRRTMEAFPEGGRSWSNQPVEDWLSARELQNLLQQCGFRPVRMTSFVIGYGSRGSYRIANSEALNGLFERTGLRPLWHHVLARSFFGLHLAVLAQKA